MRVHVQQEQKLLVITERALWRYDNTFIFTNQPEVDFGIAYVLALQCDVDGTDSDNNNIVSLIAMKFYAQKISSTGTVQAGYFFH